MKLPMPPMSLPAISVMLLLVALTATSHAESLKPRMVVLTDVSTWETDDSESLVRLMVHADLLEIEGLVFTTGWSLDNTRDDFINLIHDAINAYENDLPNLQKRSGQTDFQPDESRQEIGYWPSPRFLRNHTMFGSKKRGAEHVGERNDSPGSDLIIKLADEADDRPLWVTVWGGGNTLAQAVWRVKQDRSEEELKHFLHKLRVYTITDQDRDQRTPFSDRSHQWMRKEFEEDLFFIWDECAWEYQNGTGKKNWSEYETHIQNHGSLGSVYPKYKYGVEGDTPAFLHLLPVGLNDPNVATHGSWGGYFAWGIAEDKETSCYTNFGGAANKACSSLQNHFYPATFNNFAARMDWAKDGIGNRNPRVVIDGSNNVELLFRKPQQGSAVTLDASKSSDPDGDQLMFHWWVLPAAGTLAEDVVISNHNSAKAIVEIPPGSAGMTFHVICEVTDSGAHNLTGYRRIIFEPAE